MKSRIKFPSKQLLVAIDAIKIRNNNSASNLRLMHDNNTIYYSHLGIWVTVLSTLPLFVLTYLIATKLGYSDELTRQVVLQHFTILMPILLVALILSYKLPIENLHIYFFVQMMAFVASAAYLSFIGAGTLFLYFLPVFSAVALSGVAMVYVFPIQSLTYLLLFTVAMLAIRYSFLQNVPGVSIAWTAFVLLLGVSVLFTILMRNLFLGLDEALVEQENQIHELTKTNALLDITLNENQFGLVGFDDAGTLILVRGSDLARVFNVERRDLQYRFDYRNFDRFRTFIENLTGDHFENFYNKFIKIDLDDSYFILSAYRLNDLTIVTHMDVTEIRQIEDELRAHQKLSMIGEITSGVAHNYNNALAVALHNMEALPVDRLGDLWTEYIQPSISAIEQSAEISKKLLTLAGRQNLNIERFDMSETLLSMQKLIQSAIGSDIALTISCSEELWIETDKREFESAILNLAINGRNACMKEKNAQIRILTNVTSGYATASVIDNGHGIQPEILKKIFDPFFTTHSQKNSSGLGLSTVKGFVEQSHGFVDVHSRVGRTQFDLFFPLCEATSQDHSKTINSKTVSNAIIHSNTVLFVDDNVQLLESLSRLLNGMKVSGVYENIPHKALQLVEQNRTIKTAVLDLSMPEMNGIELGEKILKIRPDMKLYLMTGEISTEQIALAKKSGFTDVYIKPMRASQLISLFGADLSAYEIASLEKIYA